MRHRLAWLVTMPISLLGAQLAHLTVNALVGAPAGELFQAGGPGSGVAMGLIAVLGAVLALAFTARIAGAWTAPERAAVRLLPFAMVAPTAFVLQEQLETALRGGGLSFATMLEPTFLPGLALQMPFALAAYLVARALLRLADGVRRLIADAAPARAPAPVLLVLFPTLAEVPRPGARSSACSGRAPPVAPATG
jgi:hypothetical protein